MYQVDFPTFEIYHHVLSTFLRMRILLLQAIKMERVAS